MGSTKLACMHKLENGQTKNSKENNEVRLHSSDKHIMQKRKCQKSNLHEQNLPSHEPLDIWLLHSNLFFTHGNVEGKSTRWDNLISLGTARRGVVKI